jgi:hypothetical protein
MLHVFVMARGATCGAFALATALVLGGCASEAVDGAESGTDDVISGRARVTHGDDGALRLTTPLTARVESCTNKASCTDADGDGLVDAWEALILERLHPAVTFDEDEPLLGKDDAFAALGRVYARDATHVTAIVLLVYAKDYGAPNWLCFGASAHAGDVERDALDLELQGKGDVIVRNAFTTGHEGTEDDQSRVWKSAELSKLETIEDEKTKEPRWRVYASQSKHATYASKEHCENVRLAKFTHRFCVNEDCAPDRVRDSARYTRVPAISNAGEPGKPIVDDLAPLGFKGERAWSDAKFCGGLTVDAEAKKECPPSIKSKLLLDPFRK